MAGRLLYLVRHGAYDPDPADPLHGGSLNDAGVAQVSALGERLSGVRFSAMHHSTALRAVETADVLAFTLPAVPRFGDDLLRECIPTVPDDGLLTPSQRDFFARLPADVRREGPHQARAAVERYGVPSDTDERVLLVTHGNLINFFVASALEAPPHGWLRPLDYHCGLTVIRYADTVPPRLITYNDTGHLPADGRGLDYPAELRI
ncbi:putative phosphoglycerate mutase [Stackebrandtia albiflava]|uniref:Putative phosphoglycerate mutase n=1 Tax=Stackebrandtia albiflava TaxID=406432 RepID=A0A562V4K6_9ACTN|nr:histidine phosphatase family protein [Stackebrandtia albiflava]TWJ12824.1 putative phosphoglycerate mutase [Stackebrandtia albiflava]